VHPLDPLTADEIRTAVAIVKKAQDLGDEARFPLITLREPSKRGVLAFQEGDPIDRDAFVVVLGGSGATYEALVSLNDEKVRTWRLVPGAQPSLTLEEIFLVEDIVKASPVWREAIARRGVTELDQVQVDPWSAGNFGIEAEQGSVLCAQPRV
jgi:primary-amine oxidase